MNIDIVEVAQEIETLVSKEFLTWLPNNLHIWEAFCEQAFKVRERGFSHYSSRTIIHFLRHHSAINEVGGPWKINNNYSPYLARLFDHRFPGSAGLWEYRETKRAKADHGIFGQDES
jgi:hypothetical protein